MKYTIEKHLKERILVLDGAMGTSIQEYNLSEQHFRGSLSVKKNQNGNNDILNLTEPELIKSIHNGFLDAGADIIETNTFNSSRISQENYGLETMVYELNFQGTKLARDAADAYNKIDSKKPRFVAGSIGPTNKSLSISADIENPGIRNINFDGMVSAYEEQIEGLVDGGVDLLLIETVYDSLNARAAIFAADNVLTGKGIELPLIISGTIADKSGRILSGETLEAFAETMKNHRLLSIGLNCSFGAKDLMASIKYLSRTQESFISFYPNAGLPNSLGKYEETPEMTAGIVKELAEEGHLNIVGGCCGTTVEHIRAISEAVKDVKPRILSNI